MIVLEILQGTAAQRTHRVLNTGGTATIGRSPASTVVLGDFHLSGDHAQITQIGEHYVFRDLRSTNGSSIERDGRVIAVDAAARWEVALVDGDVILLGNPNDPVRIAVRIGDDGGQDLGERLIASRSIMDLPAIADQIEGAPADALRVYKALQPLGARLEPSEVIEACVAATFELLSRATHVAILLRSDTDKDRFALAVSRERNGATVRAPATDPVRASRAILRRVLGDRAAVLTANAQEALSSESILAGQILSILALPLWRGDDIIGLIQADNRSSAGMFHESDLEVGLLLCAQASLAIDNATLVQRLRVAEERARGENVYLKRKEQKIRFDNIIGESPAMKAVLGQLERVIDTRATVCIEGETGTGKELIAAGIHHQSARADKMFVAQNCAALPENLLESELFGHKRGAFTSADSDKKGLFEIADGGTLFLDEMGEMPLTLQAKLLRVLQEGTIRPVGATSEKQVDVRIICATNRDLSAEVEKQRFRQDLYYRLMVFPIKLPPLRERREDIPLLAAHFLKRYAAEYRAELPGFTQDALDALSSYNWPGNIRELENEIQRLVIQAEPSHWIEITDLSPRLRKVEGTITRIAPKQGTLKEMMEQVERWLITEALREHGNNKTKTAATLGITREGLHKKLAKFGV
ncbi:MAG: sigma 54-interacting transcriptional regulator [Deltaproteobacteria bacterium]|nr:sigma 54-interacting transcriptional regulator [Deltaproteobacteria bacterium]MCW5805558.1 sigma 54-interacting transcriptional regulator [Deltaproteobacteria bacterium]